jgi:hypothetical protein
MAEVIQVVRIDVGHDPASGLFSLTSSAVPGLFLAGRDLSALQADVPTALKVLSRLNEGIEVEVREIKSKRPAPDPVGREFELVRAA